MGRLDIRLAIVQIGTTLHTRERRDATTVVDLVILPRTVLARMQRIRELCASTAVSVVTLLRTVLKSVILVVVPEPLGL